MTNTPTPNPSPESVKLVNQMCLLGIVSVVDYGQVYKAARRIDAFAAEKAEGLLQAQSTAAEAFANAYHAYREADTNANWTQSAALDKAHRAYRDSQIKPPAPVR